MDVCLSLTQLSVLIFVTGYYPESQHVLKPVDRLIEITHADLNPACFAHFSAPLRKYDCTSKKLRSATKLRISCSLMVGMVLMVVSKVSWCCADIWLFYGTAIYYHKYA